MVYPQIVNGQAYKKFIHRNPTLFLDEIILKNRVFQFKEIHNLMLYSKQHNILNKESHALIIPIKLTVNKIKTIS